MAAIIARTQRLPLALVGMRRANAADAALFGPGSALAMLAGTLCSLLLPLALPPALGLVLLAAVGVLLSFRMVSLPDIKPSADLEGLAFD